MKNEISIYIHIPFCISKCNYCSFNSYPVKNYKDIISDYFKKLVEEVEFHSSLDFEIKTIYIGGGTPSIVDPIFLENLLNKIFAKFKVKNKCEISIEINPGTVNKEKIDYYKRIGINRISIGVQSFNDNFLKFLGRIYNFREIFKCIEIVESKYENFSLDLIFGIPSQSIDDLKGDLSKVREISPPHISYYSLTVEEGTKFFTSGINEVSEEIFSEMYDLIVEFLNETGLEQYEISNFSKRGFECLHNLNYWNYGNYLGFGAGAVSFIGDRRWRNFSEPVKYIKSDFDAHEEYEVLNRDKMEFEYIFMNLRKVEGIKLIDFEKRFGKDFFNEYSYVIEKYSDYFKINHEKVSLTKEGFKVSNLILSEFLK